MNSIAKIDAWLLLEACEPFAWRFEYRFRKNCFWLARATLTLSLLVFNGPWMSKSIVLTAMFLPAFTVAWFTFMVMITQMERYVVSRPNHLNSWKPRWGLRFAIFCVHALMMISHRLDVDLDGVVTDGIGGFLLVATFYFMSCNPMPPKWEPPKPELSTALLPQAT